MLEKEVRWSIISGNDRWKRIVLNDYRLTHSRTKYHGNYDEVVMQFNDKKEWIRSRDYHRRYFDYETLLHDLRVNMRGAGCSDQYEC